MMRSRRSHDAPRGITGHCSRSRGAPNHTHRDVNGGWLRPAVFGAMDGLVSNLALMTGVAGGAVVAADHRHHRARGPGGRRLLHGGRGVHLRRLAARARPGRTGRRAAASCASTRWTRWRSWPRSTTSRGVEPALAREVARQLSTRPRAGAGDPRPRGAGHRPGRPALARRSPRSRPSGRSRWARCCPYCRICSGATALWPAVLLALVGLFACGAVVARVTARTWWFSGLRQLALGGAAAGVTYVLGSLFGAAVG